MQYELNTKQARKLVAALIKQKDTAVWSSWTNGVQKDLDNNPNKRNLCFGILGDKFTAGECKWIKLLVGCDKVHTTHNGHYLRLVGVKFEG
jgi:hypothetical protein